MTEQDGLFELGEGLPADRRPTDGHAAEPGAPVGRADLDAAPASGRFLVIETDGGSRGNPGPAGYGAVVRDGRTGALLAERADYLGVASNNVAEYTAVVEGLRAAAAIDPGAEVEVRADSRLVVEQMSGRWKIRHADMRDLAARARAVLPPHRVRYIWVPRAQNGAADALANAAMDTRAAVRRDHGDPPATASTGPAPATAPGVGVTGAVLPGGVGTDADDTSAADANAPRASGTPLPRAVGSPVTVVLVRHGVTALTESGHYSGGDTPGPPLSPLGREQAARAGTLVTRLGVDLWADLPVPSALVPSPMVRTRETAEALGAALGLTPAEPDDRFAECRFGQWDGLSVEQIESGWPGELLRWATEADHRPPGGESLRDVGARVARGLRALAAAHAGATVVVAAHTVVVRAAVGLVGRVAADHWSAVRIPPASVTVVRVWPQVDAAGRLVGDLTVVGCPSELVDPAVVGR
ncbi:bifunctional RNase H/acid phosphatase [Georgenia muralis]|uniref:Putative phosphoglycerate mutase n=1 Tax=Georgenia muralis TaxID=154117 RepID=A0A3N4ZBS0_9MICO|nr:bifunctional RNase H/acid phosphatase [Georgenia muralis]RPF28720.1 putative phosphoglycerate mutase [Georgenia muralis]